jgi:soluble P-type ATPase
MEKISDFGYLHDAYNFEGIKKEYELKLVETDNKLKIVAYEKDNNNIVAEFKLRRKELTLREFDIACVKITRDKWEIFENFNSIQ